MIRQWIDLVFIVKEGIGVAMEQEGLGAWWLGAVVMAIVTFMLNLYFIRLCNRRYEPKVWHFTLFGLAAIAGGFAALSIPVTRHLEPVIVNRLQGWGEFVKHSNVPVQPAWNKEREESGLGPLGAEVSWPEGFGYRARIVAKERGYHQDPIRLPAVVYTGHGGAVLGIQLELMLKSFRDQSPALHARIKVPFEDLSAQYAAWHHAMASSSPAGIVYFTSTVDWTVSTMFEYIGPQVPDLARSIRVAAILAMVLLPALPALLLGIIAYSQIRVGFDRRSRERKRCGSVVQRRRVSRSARRTGRTRRPGKSSVRRGWRS